jgi:autotransporter-associated beta strand protein
MENQSTTQKKSSNSLKLGASLNWLSIIDGNRSLKKSLFATIYCLFSFLALINSNTLIAQTNVSATWGTNGSTAWYTGANWVGGAYPGIQGAAASNSNIATFTTGSTGNPFGINMGTASLNLGAIEILSARTTATNITNSSGTAGVLRLYGATVNSIANTVVRHNGTNTLTLQTANTMGIVLSNPTDNKFTIDNTGALTIASLLSGTGNFTKDGAGSGVLTLTNSGNSYSGTTTITTGELRLNPTANATFASQIILNGGTLSTTSIALNRTWTSTSTLNLNANSTIALGSNSHTITFANSSAISWAGTTLTVNGWTGTAGASGTGGKIVVGAGGLSAGQLSKISFTGFPGTPIIVGGEVVPPGAGGPTIIPSPSSLTALDYMFGSGPSVAQTFTISASNLTGGGGNITFDATTSPNYEVSTTSPGTGGYGATATLAYTGTGTLAANTIWVRLKSGLSVGNYNLQNISISGGGATSSITASGSVTAIPYMVLPTLNTAVTENMDVMGTAAATSTITNIPVGFKSGTDWNTGTTVNTVAGGTTGAGTISAGGFYNFANGINASATDRGLGYLFSGGFSSPRSIVLRFRNNTGATVRQLDVAFDYEKYRNGQITLTNTFTHGASPTPAIAEPLGTQVYTTDGNNSLVNPATTISKSFSLSGLSIADGTDYYFMWTFTGSASTNAIAVGIDNFSVTPRDQSLLTSVNSLSGFNYTGAGPSAELSFTISGDNLSSNVVLTPPTNYEISLTSGSGFVASPSNISITPVGGIIPSQPRTIFVRLKAGLSGGLYNGENITLTSGIISKTVTLNGGVVPEVNLGANFNAGSEIGTTVVTLTATASSAVSGAQTVTVGFSGTGITAGDYTLGGGDLSGLTLTIPNGGTTATFTFTIANDLINEGNETAAITISAPSSGIVLGSTASQNIAITDDDDAIYLNVINTAEPAVTFDDLASSGTTNALNIKGAYMFETIGNTTYAADNGGSSAGNTYSYGNSSDRALGSLASGGNSPIHVGLKLRNNTGTNMNAIDINYVGEQWRCGGNTSSDVLYFEYSTDATSLSTGTWNSFNALNMVSVINNAGISALNGNLPTNQTALSGIVGLGNIPDGAAIWIRWRDENLAGSDHGMGVDDVVLTPLFYSPTTYYTAPTGDLDNLATWGSNPGGTGISPTNFTSNAQTFNIDQATATIGANWAVTGAASKVVVGNGSTSTIFNVPSAFTFTSTQVDVSAIGTLVLNNSTTPNLGVLDANSTIAFAASSGSQNIPAINYGNITFSNAGTKNIQDNTSVSGNIILDGATMNSTAGGFRSITYSGDITILSDCTYNTSFFDQISFVTDGNGHQTVFGNNNTLQCSQFNSLTKTSGSLTLSSLGGSTTITTKDDVRLLMPAGVLFTDNGNLMNVGGDFENAGVTNSYVLTGTLQMNGLSAAAVNIRLNGTGGSQVAGVARINNLILNSSTSNQVNFQPISTGSATTIVIKGDFTIQGTSNYTGGINLGGTSVVNTIQIGGNYSNIKNLDVINPGISVVEFNGSVPQTFSAAFTGGENFYRVRINNSNGVTMTSGDFNVTGTGAGTLACSSGVLNTGSGKVVLGPAAQITETISSNVIGYVHSTRTLTNAVESFGGMGFTITANGAAPGITTLIRETGVSYNVGCLSSSVKRKYSLSAATNTGLDAQIIFGYLPSVAELNGLTESSLGMFTGGGPWTIMSTLSNLNTSLNRITVNSINSLGEYIVSTPSPNAVVSSPTSAFSCGAASTLISSASSSFGTLLWTHDGLGSISGQTGLTPTYQSVVGDIGNTVTLTLTASNTTCPDATATFLINVVDIPTASVIGTAPHSVSCENGLVTAVGVSALNSTSVSWSIVPTGGLGGYVGAGSIISGGASFAPTYQCNALDAGQNVTLQMITTGVGGCTSAPIEYVINVRPRPTVTITPNATNICNDVNGVFRLLSISSPEANTNYIWSPITDLYLDAAFTIPYTANTPATQVYSVPFVSTVYSVTATNTNTNCTTGASTVSLTVCSALTNSICQADAPTPAVNVTNTPTYVTYSLLGATASAGVPCAPIARDVYYRVVVPSSGEIHVVTAPGTNAIANLNVQSTVVSIHYAVGGSCTTSPVVACNSGGAAGSHSYVSHYGMTPGSIAYIRLGSTVAGNSNSAQFVRMAVTSGLVWTGTANSSFNNPANWLGGDASALTVPDLNKSVILRPVTTPAVAPIVSGAQTVKSLTMLTSALLSINSGATLDVKGDNITLASNNILGNGTVVLSGTASQSISGSGRINYLKINNASGVTVSGVVRVGGLDLQQGVVTTNNNLTLLSDAGLTGYLNNFQGGYTGSLSGNLNVERRVVLGSTSNASPDHYLASPVVMSGTVSSNYNDDFSVVGSPAGYIYNSDPAVAQPSVFPSTWTWDETQTIATIPGWTGAGATTLAPGQGFSARVPGTRIVDIRGIANNAGVNRAVTLTDDGLNLIGNPYPSSINFSTFASANASTILPVLYIWNPANSTYASYAAGLWSNNPAGPGASDVIGHSQSFFVFATQTGSVSFSNSMRTVNQAANFFAAPEGLIRLEVSSNGQTDEAVVATNTEATENYDQQVDAKKLLNALTPSILAFTLSADNTPLAINAVDKFSTEQVIPVQIIATTAGEVNIKLNMADLKGRFDHIYLEDATLGTYTDLKARESYTATVSQGNSGSRFFLHFSKPSEVKSFSETKIYAVSNTIFTNLSTEANGTLELVDLFGKTVYSSNFSGKSGRVAFEIPAVANGTYIVKLVENGKITNQKVVINQ